MAITSAVVAVVVGAIGADQQHRAQKATRKAQKEASASKRRSAELENQQRARRHIAARRVQQAELIAASEATNAGGLNSAVSGAVGSLSTQTAAEIGAANNQFAGDVAAQSALFKGQKTADRYNTSAAYAGVVSNAVGSFGASFNGQTPFLDKFKKSSSTAPIKPTGGGGKYGNLGR